MGDNTDQNERKMRHKQRSKWVNLNEKKEMIKKNTKIRKKKKINQNVNY